MSERNNTTKLTAKPHAAGGCSSGGAKLKSKAHVKRRGKVSFDEAVKLILTEDAPLLRRLAD